MLNPNVLVRYYGVPTERVTSKAGSETAPTWKAVKRPNGKTDYIRQPDENVYEKIQKAGEGYDLASAIARLEAGDFSIKAKSTIYTEGTPLENLFQLFQRFRRPLCRFVHRHNVFRQVSSGVPSV